VITALPAIVIWLDVISSDVNVPVTLRFAILAPSTIPT
jgi:hypothetical protein